MIMSDKAKATLMGVCATISNKFDIDVFIVRCIAICFFLSSMGTFAIIYFLLGMFAIEKE
jgi:phage shock protein PspC (stress-responsive transcriptional regulator)